ncbi:hypothetical protein TorRG33x02_295510 [Trema orientale]|uniref:Uncharacterized protein n=1 Tax=Trema orientale TaxID=63057 RepID=A0A2P5C6U4_TREOI|nr:hypothetical protein TorRG33x02_295510 [Trema orientale]
MGGERDGVDDLPSPVSTKDLSARRVGGGASTEEGLRWHVLGGASAPSTPALLLWQNERERERESARAQLSFRELRRKGASARARRRGEGTRVSVRLREI